MATEKFYWNVKALCERDLGNGIQKKHWLRIGSAKSSGDSDVIEVFIDALPLHWKGSVSLFPVEEGPPAGGDK